MKALYSTVILLFLASVSPAGEWRIEAVDSSTTVDVGGYNSLALDSSGYPHISYCDYTNDDLKYARWDGAEWRIETVDSADDVGEYTSLRLDDFDNPHISYYDDTNVDLKYACWDGAAWQIETVDSEGEVGSFSSLALDSSDYPHISYCDWDNDYLKYARWDGSNWQIETVDSEGITCYYISLALDSNDYPHISYCDYTNGDLKYARWDGSEWRIETVDSEGYVGSFTSLALDDYVFPHISYNDSDNRVLKYARWDGAEWRIETVDSEGDVGQYTYTSLELDSNDNPRISYGYFLVWVGYDLKYASWDGSSWHIETVDSEGNVGSFSSLALDFSDNPHISYCDEGNGNLKYARYEPNRFHLLSPGKGDTIYEFPFTFDWEDYDLDGLESYTLWWGTDPDFITYNEVADIGESEYTITGGIEDGARVYWRVKSIDEGGGEYWAEELDWYFDVDLGGGVDVVDFSAGATDEGVLVNWRLSGEEPFAVRVLRGAVEPELISGNLPGGSTVYLDRGVEPGVGYGYWLETVDALGVVERFGPTEEVRLRPGALIFGLDTPYPQPVDGMVHLNFTLPEDGRVELAVYDLAGRRVATVMNADSTAGRHQVVWDCSSATSGVYLVRLSAPSGVMTNRVVVAR